MKACIMCGGEGTRLRPLTFDRPKPTIPILNKPSVVHLVEHLAKEGFSEIVITIGYLGNEIEDALGDGQIFGVHIDYVRDEIKLGTAGSVKNAEKYLKGEPFIVIGGDHVMDLNLREFYRFHEQNDAKLTIGLLPIEDPREYGIADLDVFNQIHKFAEKPEPGEIFSNLASTGIYICDPVILDMIPPATKFDFAKDLFPKMMDGGERINGYLVRGHWTDIGNAPAYREACKWKLDKLPGTVIHGHFNTKDAKVLGPVNIGNGVSVGSDSSLVGPIMIGDNTTIGNRVLIGPYTSIGSNCVIKDGARILSAIIFNDVEIGRNTSVSGAIIDNNTKIGNNCILETETVIGPRDVIRDNVTIHSKVSLWPELVIDKGTNVKETRVNPDFNNIIS
ncbi:MAG TPA: NDP-sugar synthase [Candidatus Nanoarchaeia archaeon]|nr:NDP-sugar synthase [Candidatus Nanoarchaeia archaeon]